MKILGISFISNLAAGMSTQPLSHKEVQEAADLAAPKFRALVTEVIRRIGEHESQNSIEKGEKNGSFSPFFRL